MELYNLGIGLSVVDTASKPVQAVDAALISMSKATDYAGVAARAVSGDLGGFAAAMRSASGIASEFDMILSGNSVDNSLVSVGDAATNTTTELAGLDEQLASTTNQSRNLADISDMLAEKLAAEQNQAAEAHYRASDAAKDFAEADTRLENKTEDLDIAIRRLGKSFGFLGQNTEELPGHVLRMRDAWGRFTAVSADGSIDSIAGQMANVIQKSGDLWDTIKGGSTGFMLLGNELGKVAGRINETVAGFASLQWLGSSMQETFLDFGDSSQKLAVGFGGAAEDAYELRSAMLDVGLSTQYSLGEVTKLTGELATAGVDLRDMAEEQRNAFVGLNHTFNVSGQDIAAMSSTMSAFGGDMLKTLDDASAFQKGFGIQGIFDELPGVIAGAQTAVIQFGDAVSSSVPNIVRNVTRTAGVFAKAYGQTMRDAVQSAQADFNKFVGASRTHMDVFLGLADGFDPLQEALMEVGVPLMETKDIMDQAQQSPLDFASSMRTMMSSMGDFQKRRFRRQLQLGGISDDLMGLINNQNRYNDAINAEAEARAKEDRAVRTGVASFKELNAGMLDTVKETKAMWENVKELGKAFLAQTGLAEVLKNTFAGAKDVLAGFSEKIRALVESDKMRAWGKTLVPILSTVGKWFLVIGTAVGGVVGALGGMATAMGSLRTGGKALEMVGKWAGKLPGVGKIFGGLSKGLGSVAKVAGRAIPGIGQVIAAVSGVSTAVMDMGDVLGDPSATGSEKFQALMRGTFKGVGSAFNSLLLGLPGMLAGAFFPDMEKQFDNGFADLFSGLGDMDVGAMLGGLWDKFTGWLAPKLQGLDNWLLKNLPDWGKMAKEWGKTIGGAMGGLARMAVDALIWGVKNLSLPVVLYNLWKFAFNDGMKGAAEGVSEGGSGIGTALLSIVTSAGEIAFAALQGIGEGVLGAFGTSAREVRLGFGLMWNYIKTGVVETIGFVAPKVATLWESMGTGALNMVQFVAGKFFWLKEIFGFVIKSFQSGWERGIGAVKVAVLSIAETIVTKLSGKGGVLDSTLSGIESLLTIAAGLGSEAGISGVLAIQGMKRATAGFGSDIARELVDARAAIAKNTDLTEEWAEAQKRVKNEQAEFADNLKPVKDAFEGMSETTAKYWKGQKDDLAQEKARLEREAAYALAAREKKITDAKIAGKFRRDSVSKIDAAINSLGENAAVNKFDEGQSKAAVKVLRNHMDSALSALTKSVRAGDMKLNVAEEKLNAAQKEALRRAIKAGKETQRKAGDVSGAAKGKDTKTSAEKKQFQLMLHQFSQSLAKTRRESIEIRFAGRTGDAVSKDMQRRVAISRRNTGAG